MISLSFERAARAVSKPLPFRGGVGVGRIPARRRSWIGPTPGPSPEGEGRIKP